MKKKQVTCLCKAYKFPHREFSGKCWGQPDDEEEDYGYHGSLQQEYELLGESFRSYSNPNWK